jgi:chaperonin GroES
MSKLKPINGIAVLKWIEEDEMTYGNIVIPDMGKEKPEVGEVVAFSDTYNWHHGQYVPSNLVKGQKVLIPKMGSMKVTVDGEDYILIKETEILAILEN